MVFTRADLKKRFLPRWPGSVALLLFLARIRFSFPLYGSLPKPLGLHGPALIDLTGDAGFSFRPGALGKLLHSGGRCRGRELIHQREQSPLSLILNCAIQGMLFPLILAVSLPSRPVSPRPRSRISRCRSDRT